MNEENFVLNHIKTMYYRMTSLVLAQRVLSLYYSREISEISKELDENKLTNEELRARVNTLNRDYLRFVNNVYFREVTPQDQGIELYDLLQDQMNIKRDEEGLSTEVEQLYHYVTMTNDEQRNEEAEKLSFIATLFLVPTLISGIWGMNIGEAPLSYVIYAIVTTSVLAAIFILFQKFKRNR
jgi:Mg2+ and Co2+ transporter CorA